MAILRKGIIGTPKGKIGKVMGYTRNGKGVLQRVPTVIDKQARLNNFYSKAVRTRVQYLWQFIPTALKNRWGSIAPVGMTSESYYNQYNRDLALISKPSNITNLYFSPPFNMDAFDFDLSMDYDTKLLTITINGDSKNQFGNDIIEFRCHNLRDNGSSIPVSTQAYVNGQYVYTMDLSSAFVSGLLCFFVFARWSGPTTQSQYLYLDTVNPRT